MRRRENLTIVAGMITSTIEYVFSTHGEKFYRFDLLCTRLSGTADTIPCIIPETLIKHITSDVAEFIGEIRTRNVRREDGTSRLDLFLFIKEVDEYGEDDKNKTELTGYICKAPIYRKTPLGREIADLLIASNRPYGKSDYIPCIAWGRNALIASDVPVGEKVRLSGRLQSREYVKMLDDETRETRVAYELSASSLEVLEEGEETDESIN